MIVVTLFGDLDHKRAAPLRCERLHAITVTCPVRGCTWIEVIPAINGLALACYELRFQPLVQFLRPPQGFLHVVADVFWSDYFREFPLVDQLCGLLAGAAKDQRALAGMQGLGDFFEGEESCCV